MFRKINRKKGEAKDIDKNIIAFRPQYFELNFSLTSTVLYYS